MDQQAAKNNILKRIREGKPASHPLPDVPVFPYGGNPVEDFITHLLGFDGQAIKFRTREQGVEWLLSTLNTGHGNRRVYSTVGEIQGNVTESELSNLKNAARISVFVTEGELGVGEMGAIWVTGESLVHPVCALLSRHIYIFLDVAKIVGGLHEAYGQLKIRDHQYGSFYTGPSATADIEAVHITGAQGPLAMTVLLYNCEDAPEPPQLLVNPNADTSKWAQAEEENEEEN